MKILNLVLYCDKYEYCRHMKDILAPYYKRSSDNIITIFYQYSSNIDSEFVKEGDMLLIKGEESFVPGILNKTLKTFEYIIQTGLIDDVDYIIRSNVSTVINFDLLMKELKETPLRYYGGGLIHTLRWKDASAGIIDDRYNNTTFANGTSIMMTKNAFHFLMDNKNLIKKNIVDDVAIGIFFKENRPLYYPPQEIGIRKFKTMDTDYNNIEGINELKKIVQSNKYIFYRNRWGNRDRMVDISHMKLITNFISI